MSLNEKEPNIHGHAIDGIEEYDNPLPRWWLQMFYGSIIFAVVYQVMYPSWFGAGTLNWSQNTDYKNELEEAKVLYPKKEVDIMQVINKSENIEKGKAIFSQNCASCHGAEAKGLVGPNLTDDVWINGGLPTDIQKTITNGVKVKGMPTWGPVLGNEKVSHVASFVYSLSHDLKGNLLESAKQKVAVVAKQEKAIDIEKLIGNKDNIAKGKALFATNCISCHGPEAKCLVGPNLTDNVWINGGKPTDIQRTITNGVPAKAMPTWGPILGNEKIADLATFIYSLSHK